MSQINKYYHLKNQLQYIRADMRRFEENKIEQKKMEKRADELNGELNALINEFSMENSKGEDKKSDLLAALTHIIHEIEAIRGRNLYPGLNQNMIISGYLFGMIVSELRLSLKLDVGIPTNPIYAQGKYKPWECDEFLILLNEIKDELINTKFASFLLLIQFFEDRIEGSIWKFVEELRNKGII